MVNLRPFIYFCVALTIILFALFIVVGLSGSTTDIFFFTASLVSGGTSYILFRKYKEDKETRRH